ETPAVEAEAPVTAAPPEPARPSTQPAAQPAAKIGGAPANEEPAKEAATTAEPPPAPSRSAFPLRPPLAGPGTPSMPVIRGPAIPVRSAPPPPKPGQILSGPRQPMPPGAETPRPVPGVGAAPPAA